ncbi:putative cytochrome p450 protein [Lasiodiplodia theobromae]|uniref:Cytochrome P450 monooxygenase tenB n=1 Tax=Lasiodiplodia theobromae TaxID=45133 RepID=A0A5N5DII0_9PEZI|nr:Cytochrome p450 [Lasiodiplodia theobromae]KAB2576822.1 Cytochrome P450 monooxygenase tenB [Lasiodiplodia theobromae]KAF4534576.1 Cytochrome p450 [Lasiodiplodia theobromae]KAF9636919.1 putative cytochrome p450 protein [Lasiodiplodia theobromae]
MASPLHNATTAASHGAEFGSQQHATTTSLVSQITLSNVAAALALYVVASTLAMAVISKPLYPRGVPWVGGTKKEGEKVPDGGGLLASAKAMVMGVVHMTTWVKEGYEKYSKQNRTFILPSQTPGAPPELVLPRSQMAWLLEQPDNVLSTSASHYDSLNGDYSFLTPALLADPYHEHVIHRSLARNLNPLIPAIDAEVRDATDRAFGLDTTEWKSVNVWDALLDLVPQVTNRMLVGAPLCRDRSYLAAMVGFTNDVVRNMLLFTFIPAALKPLVGPVLGLPNWLHWKRTARQTLPLVRQRLADMEAKDAGAPGYENWEEPNDYLSWHIRLARRENRQDELDPVRVTQRITPLNFASIHTTVMTAHATILDLLASDPADGFLDGLREEAARVWKEEDCDTTGTWNKNGLARLLRADSAIRESMRVSAFAQTLVGRKVVAPAGITNAAEGWHVPQGAKLSLPLWGAQHDPDLFDRPDAFDAFRHSREREAWEAKTADERGADRMEEGLRLKQKGMVTTGDTHFPWGHGRHACPGRFFVAHELKMLLAYLVQNYDIKPLAERPKTRWIGMNIVPAVDARIEVRRKPGTVPV